MRLMLFVLLSLLLIACIPQRPPQEARRVVEIGAPILSDDFDRAGTWTEVDQDGLLLYVADDAYNGLLSRPGQFLWGINRTQHNNAVLEVDIQFKTTYERAIAGLICRSSGSGQGYYFLISADGAFSIRRVGQFEDVPLVRWQNHRAIHSDGGRRNTIRAICDGSYLGMVVNGVYLGGVEDTQLSDGYTGLALGLPPNAGTGDYSAVSFYNVRGWASAAGS
jgi:hypothetical protein